MESVKTDSSFQQRNLFLGFS